jgi:hypothetical protein
VVDVLIRLHGEGRLYLPEEQVPATH